MKIKYKNVRVVFLIVLTVLTACNQPQVDEKTFKANDLTVKWTDQQTSNLDKDVAQTKLSESATNDLNITKQIKTRSRIELGLTSMMINVNTTQGMVTLNGKLDTQAHIIIAGTIASEVSGVKGVRNQLITQ